MIIVIVNILWFEVNKLNINFVEIFCILVINSMDLINYLLNVFVFCGLCIFKDMIDCV